MKQSQNSANALEDTNKEKNKDKNERNKLIVHIALTLMAIGISGFTCFYNYPWPGEIQINRPTGYCISRGFNDLSFQSDYLIIQVTVENTGVGTKIIEQPTLLLVPEGNQRKPIVFELAGYVPDLNFNKLHDIYEPGYDLTIPGKSNKTYRLVFNIENWWDKKSENYRFNFNLTDSELEKKGYQKWKVYLGYIEKSQKIFWKDEHNNYSFFTITIYPTINNMSKEGNYFCDCFPLNDNIMNGSLRNKFISGSLNQ